VVSAVFLLHTIFLIVVFCYFELSPECSGFRPGKTWKTWKIGLFLKKVRKVREKIYFSLNVREKSREKNIYYNVQNLFYRSKYSKT